MIEKNLIEQLEGISKQERPEILPGAKSVYLYAGWFSDEQEKALKHVYTALLSNPTVAYVHVPLLNQHQGENPFVGDEFKPSESWGFFTYNNDITAIDNSDIGVGIIELSNPDLGSGYEIGYMRGSHKPTVTLALGDNEKNPLNLMVSFGSSRVVYSPEEIENMDFRSILGESYQGPII